MSGRFSGQYIVYVRKSTDDAELQKNSLSFQRRSTARYAKAQSLPIAHVDLEGFCSDGFVSEKHSAFKSDGEFEITAKGQMIMEVERPKFTKALYYLSRGCFKGCIFLCWDRACRNDRDSVALKRLIKSGVDIHFVTTQYEKGSSGALHMDIDSMFSEHHSRVTSEKVREMTKSLREQGVCTYRAPVGYLNEGDMHRKPIDPIRGPLIVELFNRYDTGTWTLHALERWAADIGFTMPAMRPRRTAEQILTDEENDEVELPDKIERPLTYGTIHKILSNRFYTGYVKGNNNGQWIKSVSHNALISSKTFQSVQKKLLSRRVSLHYPVNLDLQYRKFVRCRTCERLYTPYVKKGLLYFGAKCQSFCVNRKTSFNTDYLEDKIGSAIANLHFSEQELEEFEARAHTDLVHFETRRDKEIEQRERQKKRIREEQKYIENNKLMLLRTGVYSPDDLVTEELRLADRLKAIRLEETHFDGTLCGAVIRDVTKISELVKSTYTYYKNSLSEEREKIARITFSELYVNENTFGFSLTNGMKVFERRLGDIGDPIGWLSELYKDRQYIKSNIISISEILDVLR